MTRSDRNRRLEIVLAAILVGAGLLALVMGVRPRQPEVLATATPRPSRPGERLVPTETPQASAVVLLPTATPVPTSSVAPVPPTPTAGASALPSPSAMPAETQPIGMALGSVSERIGVVVPFVDVEKYDVKSLGIGWYLRGGVHANPPRPAGMECVQLVVTSAGTLWKAALLRDAADSNPGSLWLIGNEPDVIWQGNSTPQEYAQVYHDAYELLKAADPTSRVAIGGISQATPLRLRYLDAVLAAYQEAYGTPMPVDVWNIHLAILREERGSWGVDIPPGLSDDVGLLYEIDDNADIELLKEQVVAFRRWMKERGLRDKPLIVTEFSVLMPPEYGFPFERVRAFMVAAFDFLLTATDDSLGYPADGNRLVQRAAWYSLADDVYFTGNLFDPETAERTPLGAALAEYTSQLEAMWP